YKYAPQWLLFGFFEFFKEPLGVGCWVATPGVKVGHLFPAACWLALGTFLAPYVDIRQLSFQHLIAVFSQFEELGVGGSYAWSGGFNDTGIRCRVGPGPIGEPGGGFFAQSLDVECSSRGCVFYATGKLCGAAFGVWTTKVDIAFFHGAQFSVTRRTFAW